jgi:hypothetical protein
MAGRMLTDDSLYDALNKLVHDFSDLIADVRKNPQRYTRGLIKVF